MYQEMFIFCIRNAIRRESKTYEIGIPELTFSDDLQLLKIRIIAQRVKPRTLSLNRKAWREPPLIPDLQHPVRWRRDMGQSSLTKDHCMQSITHRVRVNLVHTHTYTDSLTQHVHPLHLESTRAFLTPTHGQSLTHVHTIFSGHVLDENAFWQKDFDVIGIHGLIIGWLHHSCCAFACIDTQTHTHARH